MGTGASVPGQKSKFMKAAESGGFFKMVMDAKTDPQKIAAFDKIKAEVLRYFGPFILPALPLPSHSSVPPPTTFRSFFPSLASRSLKRTVVTFIYYISLIHALRYAFTALHNAPRTVPQRAFPFPLVGILILRDPLLCGLGFYGIDRLVL